MTAMTSDKDYNAGWALHHGRSDGGKGRHQSTNSSSGSGKNGRHGGSVSRGSTGSRSHSCGSGGG